MKHALFAAALLTLAGLVSWAGQDSHYRLDLVGLPADQRVLGHRDSAYTGMTWVASDSNNFLQLRFFDKVEGGICLEPGWAALAADPRLAHLKPDGQVAAGPGPLNNSAYISLFPAGLLLHAGSVPTQPRVLVVGLGSGIGIAQLAYHFPGAAIDVVDIDAAVIEMVRTGYPLLAWLEGQRLADGRARVAFHAADARHFIKEQRGFGYDLIILDAYTAGSTIPPHLMTREFFAEAAAALADGGVVLANIIGSYGERNGDRVRGEKHAVVGGALRSLRAAGLTGCWSIPVLSTHVAPSNFDRTRSRNIIVVAARHELSPRRHPEGWKRLAGFTSFPEQETGRWRSIQYLLLDEASVPISSFAPGSWIDPAVPELASAMRANTAPEGSPRHTVESMCSNRELARRAAAAVRAAAPAGSQLRGWNQTGNGLSRREIDWVLFPRETWRTSIAFARDANQHDPEMLVGPVDGPERDAASNTWQIADAPLFTDQTPNADVLNK